MKSLSISYFLFFFKITILGQSFFYAGLINDTVEIVNECPSSLYKYRIDGTTLFIADELIVLNSDKDTIFDTKFIPCDSIFAANIPCDTGFLHYSYGNVFRYDSFPPGFPENYKIDTKSSFRIELYEKGNVTLMYFSHPTFYNTIAHFWLDKEHVRDTIFIDTIYHECSDVVGFSSGYCQDTIFNYQLEENNLNDTIVACYGDVISLQGGFTYISINDFISETELVAKEDEEIIVLKDYGSCQDLDTISLSVTKPEYIEGDTIFLKEKEPFHLPYKDGFFHSYVGGCDFLLKNVYIKRLKNNQFYVPNAFSPNGDGINDVWFIPSCDYIREIKKIVISDRWGHIVATSNYWDGYNYPQGTYTGRIVFTNAFGIDEEHYFSIHLLK